MWQWVRQADYYIQSTISILLEPDVTTVADKAKLTKLIVPLQAAQSHDHAQTESHVVVLTEDCSYSVTAFGY